MSITIKNLHKDLPEDQLHEAKGFTTASNNTYLKKNHEGSSEWLSEYWLQPVNGVVSGSSAPPSESSGNRFILTGSSFHSDWDSPSQHEIVEFNGTSWVGQAAVDGMRVVTLDGDSVYYFNTAWNQVTDANTDTTYAISAVDSGDDAIIRLTAGGSGSGTDDVTLVAGSNITITPSGDNITIAAADADTTYSAGDGLDLTSTTFSIDAKANGGLVIESTELAVDLGASSITGTLAVGDGGTGATTLTANGVLIGNGTSAITSVDMSTKGHILIGDGSGNPQMLAIGSDDQVLTADSSEATGVKWADASGGGGGASELNDLTDCEVSGTGSLWVGTTAASGNYNTGVGIQALDATSVTTGYNTAVGYKAASAVNVAYGQNVAVGYEAMGNAHADSQYNTCVGTQAGQDMDSGNDYNSFFGWQSGKGSGTSSGSRNAAIGATALTAFSTGGFNSGIGYGALAAVTTGNGNTGLGYLCGNTINTGTYNLFVGYDSDGVADADYQICMGFQSATSGDYAIAIGKGVTAAGDDVVIGKASNIITCDFDTDGTWSQSSDLRKKNVIGEDTLGLDFINALTPKTYKWKPAEEHPEEWGAFHLNESGEKVYDEMNTDIVMHGLIAQEVKSALDAAGVDTFGGWSEDANGQQQISKTMFVIPLITAVKELTARLEALENA